MNQDLLPIEAFWFAIGFSGEGCYESYKLGSPVVPFPMLGSRLVKKEKKSTLYNLGLLRNLAKKPPSSFGLLQGRPSLVVCPTPSPKLQPSQGVLL